MPGLEDLIPTARLLLRPHREEDADDVLDILRHPDVVRWLGGFPDTPLEHRDEASAWLTETLRREAADPLCAWRAVTCDGAVIGAVFVSRLMRTDKGLAGQCELGWHLHPRSTGNGYATEASTAMAAAAFRAGVPRLMIGMLVDNAPSIAVATRLGAVPRDRVPPEGEPPPVSRIFVLEPGDPDPTSRR